METSREKMKHYRLRGQEVLIDFDGTLCEFNYPKLGPPRDGALDFFKWLIECGLRPVVWSSRLSLDNGSLYEMHVQRWAIIRWLKDNDFPQCEVDDGRVGKRLALAYVDDRGVAADSGTPWHAVKERVMEIYTRELEKWEAYDERSQASGSEGSDESSTCGSTACNCKCDGARSSEIRPVELAAEHGPGDDQ